MPKQFLHVSFQFVDGQSRRDKLEPIFNKALDWFRYTPTSWILWTSRSAEHWYERVRPLLSDDDTVFIVKLDISERQGWVSKRFWDWLNQDRS